MTYPDEISRTSKATANGTPYVEVLATPMGGLADETLIMIPEAVADGSDATVVHVYHGYQGGEGSANASKMVPTRDALLDRNFIVISPNAFGDNWANDDFLQAAGACNDWSELIWNPTTKFIHGTSMGGLGGALVYATGTIGDVAALAMVDPAVNLESDWSYRSDYRASLKLAYNFTDYATEWAAATAGHNPMVRPASEYEDAWIYIWASPDDNSIPKSLNADQFKANFDYITNELTVQTVTGGHVQPSHFQADVLLAFYDRALGGAPVEPIGVTPIDGFFLWDDNWKQWIKSDVFTANINGGWDAVTYS